MNRFMKSLSSPIQLYTAKMNGTPIAVFMGQELVGIGKIDDITEFSVRIGNKYHVRTACTFKYVS